MERALLIGLNTMDSSEFVSDTTLDELEALLNTEGGNAVGRVIQNKDHVESKTFFGKGKLEEIRDLCSNMECTCVICDNELSPAQTKNMEEVLKQPVLDRTSLILQIFSSRARTSEGRVQVELARLKYLLPRLSGRGTQMSRQGGGGAGGTGARRGGGESKLELDQRHIRARISKLKEELDGIKRTRGVQRQRRQNQGPPQIAFVGYTNVGKSTLMGKLCHTAMEANNRLFDTLDPLTRRWHLTTGETVLCTDTVGFIRKLPHHLVESFQATLEELQYADLFVHVIDSSHPEWPGQAQVVEALIASMGLTETPCIKVLNKADLGGENAVFDTITISALTGMGLLELEQAVHSYLFPLTDELSAQM
jgi:GTP-binding protein HflX